MGHDREGRGPHGEEEASHHEGGRDHPGNDAAGREGASTGREHRGEEAGSDMEGQL